MILRRYKLLWPIFSPIKLFNSNGILRYLIVKKDSLSCWYLFSHTNMEMTWLWSLTPRKSNTWRLIERTISWILTLLLENCMLRRNSRWLSKRILFSWGCLTRMQEMFLFKLIWKCRDRNWLLLLGMLWKMSILRYQLKNWRLFLRNSKKMINLEQKWANGSGVFLRGNKGMTVKCWNWQVQNCW